MISHLPTALWYRASPPPIKRDQIREKCGKSGILDAQPLEAEGSLMAQARRKNERVNQTQHLLHDTLCACWSPGEGGGGGRPNKRQQSKKRQMTFRLSYTSTCVQRWGSVTALVLHLQQIAGATAPCRAAPPRAPLHRVWPRYQQAGDFKVGAGFARSDGRKKTPEMVGPSRYPGGVILVPPYHLRR